MSKSGEKEMEVEVVMIFNNVSLRNILVEGWGDVKKWVDENKVGVMLVSVNNTGCSLKNKLICMKKNISGIKYKNGSVVIIVYYDMDLSEAYNYVNGNLSNKMGVDYKILDFNKLEFRTIVG